MPTGLHRREERYSTRRAKVRGGGKTTLMKMMPALRAATAVRVDRIPRTTDGTARLPAMACLATLRQNRHLIGQKIWWK